MNGDGRMRVDKAFCLFEQSGTFKNELKKLGIPAEDYDICNDFGETDHVVDLFNEIDKAFSGQPSLFDEIGGNDLVFAFFPCTRFEAFNCMTLQGKSKSLENWSEEERLLYSMEKHEELHGLYMRICKLFAICLRGGWRMIVENPYTQPHYLTSYFPMKPSLVDNNRLKNGDHYKKPTQYWFVNCEHENNVVYKPMEYVKQKLIDTGLGEFKINHSMKTKRSMIHPQYAERFIKTYVLDAPGGVWTA